MATTLAILAVWCAVALVFAGVHRRWVRYEVAEPSPMDVLQVLPPYEPAHAGVEAAIPG